MKTFFTKNVFKFLSALSIKFVTLPFLEVLKIKLSMALSILIGVVLTQSSDQMTTRSHFKSTLF